MPPDDVLELTNRLNDLIRSATDPREALARIIDQFGAQRVAEEARIAFASWRSQVDFIEETLNELLAERR